MTPIDWAQAFIFVGLSALAIAGRRADFFVVFCFLLANSVLGRFAIAYTGPVESVSLCASVQALFVVTFAWRASGAAGMAIGACFGAMVTTAGFTLIGILGAETSVGPDNNYWTMMTALEFAQAALLATAWYLDGDLWD
jgi:hypothetical protein